MPEVDPWDMVVGEVAIHNGTLTVKIDNDDSLADGVSGPSASLVLHHKGDGYEVTLDYLDLDEANFRKLIDVLTKAWQIEETRARARGYYAWVEAGRPDYETNPDHPFFREDQQE